MGPVSEQNSRILVEQSLSHFPLYSQKMKIFASLNTALKCMSALALVENAGFLLYIGNCTCITHSSLKHT